MKSYKYQFLILFFALLINSCKEQDNPADQGNSTSYGTPYANVPSTGDIVMYEVNQRAFSTSGNFQGVINRLDSIKALGVNVIWLMPIHPIGILKTVNSPYCVRNYTGVNSEFGTLADLRKLADGAHSRNMAVIIDWVANHTAWDNPWIDSTNWYTKDAFGNIISPAGTNWADVADLNYNNLNMRAAMIDAMKYWILAANIDGFRCDAADMVPYDFWQQAITTLNVLTGRKLIFLAEGSRADHFTAGFQMNFGWDFYGNLKNIFRYNYNASTVFTVNTNENNSVPAGRRKLRFTSNHDESAWDATPITLFNGKSGALAASVITAYLGGVPLIYGSQEVGTPNQVPFFTRQAVNWLQNPDMMIAYKKIFNFYGSSDALKKGTLETFPDNAVVCFRKTYQNKEVAVIVNTRNSTINFSVPALLRSAAWDDAFTGYPVIVSSFMTLAPYEYVVLQK